MDQKKNEFLLACEGIGSDREEVSIQEIKGLLALGVDVNSRDGSGRTGLIRAAAHARVVVAEFLVKSGADVNAQDEVGNTALIQATHHENYLAVAKLLVDAGANVNLVNRDGETVLMRIAKTGNVEAANFLVQSGADILMKDKHGDTAISHSQNKQMRELLHAAKDAAKKKQGKGFAGRILKALGICRDSSQKRR